MKIEAQITITATYDDEIRITVYDKTSSTAFVELTLTREQFVNAAMNRLGNTTVKSADVRSLDRIGKKMEHRPFEFPIIVTGYKYKEAAREQISKYCPEGWKPDMGFESQDSFFESNGIKYAKTTIRRWVE